MKENFLGTESGQVVGAKSATNQMHGVIMNPWELLELILAKSLPAFTIRGQWAAPEHLEQHQSSAKHVESRSGDVLENLWCQVDPIPLFSVEFSNFRRVPKICNHELAVRVEQQVVGLDVHVDE